MKMLLILNATYFEQNSKSLEFISEILVIYAVYFESRYYVHFALSTFFSTPLLWYEYENGSLLRTIIER